jgi:hypothetical protein
MERRALVVALALMLPLALYGIPYAYAVTTAGQTTVVRATHTFNYLTDPNPYELLVHCPTGYYATGGGAGQDLDTVDIGISGSLPAIGGSVDLGPATPDGWVAFYNIANPSTNNGVDLQVLAVCQAPITVAGIGVPQFGSLYIAIALGAAVYFMLSRRFTRRPTISMQA